MTFYYFESLKIVMEMEKFFTFTCGSEDPSDTWIDILGFELVLLAI